MYKICLKAIAVLAVLLISLISISSAASPRAMPDLYKGQCGVELSVPAPGILTNDVKTTGQLSVLDPELITIDPKYGSIEVLADGSFLYEAAANIPSGTYVYFYYKATDGTSVTNQAIVKIAVSCKCHGIAPDILTLPDTEIIPEFLMSEGAGCMGCRDVTPKFDLSEIPAEPVAGVCYPYTVSCPGCQVVTGHVCFPFVEPRCPVAIDDHYVSPYPYIYLVVDAPGVLANDETYSGNTLYVVNPGVRILDGLGMLVLNADGSFTINATAGATFTYTATDGDCESNEATVTFDVADFLPGV